jgi:hypothetical protein
MGKFTTGFQSGSRLVESYREGERQREIDEERRWRFEQERLQAANNRNDRADLSRIAQRGMTGITPNMTTAGPSGMGPVADPRDVGLASPMSDDEQQEAISQIALRRGDVTGFNSSQDRGKKLKKDASYEALGKKLLTMSDEDLMQEYAPIFKKFNDGPEPVMFGWDEKGKRAVITKGSGDVTSLTSAELRAHIFAAHQSGNGDPEKGIATMLGLGKDREAKLSAASTRSREQAAFMAGDYRDSETLGLNRKRTEAQIRASDAAASASRSSSARASQGPLVQLVDKTTGDAVLGTMQNGKFIKADIPTGLSLPRGDKQQVTSKDVVDAAEMIMGSGPNPATGQRWTPQDAMAEARAQLANKDTGGSGVEVDLSKLAEALNAGRQRNAGAGAGRTGVAPAPVAAKLDPLAPLRDAAARGNPAAIAELRRLEPQAPARMSDEEALQRATGYVR